MIRRILPENNLFPHAPPHLSNNSSSRCHTQGTATRSSTLLSLVMQQRPLFLLAGRTEVKSRPAGSEGEAWRTRVAAMSTTEDLGQSKSPMVAAEEEGPVTAWTAITPDTEEEQVRSRRCLAMGCPRITVAEGSEEGWNTRARTLGAAPLRATIVTRGALMMLCGVVEI